MLKSISFSLIILLHFLIFHCNRADQASDGPITPQAVYSADDPGNWAGKEDEHTPLVEIKSYSGEGNIVVSITLKDASPTHYIEKIFIADKKGKPYSEIVFNNSGSGSVIASVSGPDGHPQQSGAEFSGSVYSSGLSQNHGKTWKAIFTMPVNSQAKRDYAVYARCSQHDLWMAGLE